MGLERLIELYERFKSYSSDAIRLTTYSDDYTVRGYRNICNGLIEIPATTTLNFLIDLSSVPAGSGVFALPININAASEEVDFRLYEATDYEGGTAKTCFNANRIYQADFNVVITTGATGTDKGTLLPEHAAFASSTGAATSISSHASGDSPFILNPSYNYLVELENKGASACRVEYNAHIFEIPFS